jgi:hypothetical protein
MRVLRHLAVAAQLVLASAAGAAECRQALAIGLDVSGSVDLREYRLQLDGLVTALNAPPVRSILLATPGAPVSLLVFEWSGPDEQTVLLPWTPITDETALAGVSAILAGVERRPTTPGTALGTAMLAGARHLGEVAHCHKRTLDISGDGHSNLGPRPKDVKDGIGAQGITIIGLVVGSDGIAAADRPNSDIAQLSAYFRAEVIVGPDAFVETALGFEDFAEAMTRKLRRELQQVVIGLAAPGPAGPDQ